MDHAMAMSEAWLRTGKLKLQIQYLAILQTQHWALSLRDYQSGTTLSQVFLAVAAISGIYSINIFCHLLPGNIWYRIQANFIEK